MAKQIKIEELIPFMKKGWVACDKNGAWHWYSAKPKLEVLFNIWDFYGGSLKNLSTVFNIAPAKVWTKSLIKIERK